MKKRKCKRCKGTGRVFDVKKGNEWCFGDGSAKGDACPSCGGKGER